MTSQQAVIAHTVDEAFSLFEGALKLDRREVLAARERHNSVRDCLTATAFVSDSFLQGSFARKTMVSPLHDVDVVLLLPSRDAAALHLPGGPSLSMERLKPALGECFPGVVFDSEKRADHALRLDFVDVPFHIDLVPAFDPDSSSISSDIEIADRGLDRWEWSNTRELMRVVEARNVLTKGRFIHQTRMVKTFTTVAQALDVCGLVGESLAYEAITRQVPDPVALHMAFIRGAQLTSGNLTDPTGVDDLIAGWNWEKRQRATDVFARAAARAHEALDYAEAGDQFSAISVWRSMLGEAFPSAPGGGGSEKGLFQKPWALSSSNRLTAVPAAAAVIAPATRAHASE